MTVLNGFGPTTTHKNRVTDHRIGLTIQQLDAIMSGKLDEIIDGLVLFDQTQKLEELNGPQI